MEITFLTKENIRPYLDYLKDALAEEPDMMWVDEIDEEAILKNLPHTTSMVAVEEGKILGRLEYHFYTCLQDGYRMAYVNWVYVVKARRHQGVAQALFRAFEEECRKNHINEYFLIQAQNPNAAKFYGSFTHATSENEPILRKVLN